MNTLFPWQFLFLALAGILNRPLQAIFEYADHYHRERNHQGLGNRLVEPALEMQGRVGWIECKQRLGGLLKYYCRRAA